MRICVYLLELVPQMSDVAHELFVCKLFSTILKQMLLKWSSDNNVVTYAQYGFQPKRGTAGAVFSLHTVISHY